MSKYIFIASDFELPEINLTNEQIITPKEAKLKGIKLPNFLSWEELDPSGEILYYENEEDMGNLYIRKDYSLLDNVRFYTDKEFIYEVSCSIDTKRAKQLLDYIKDIEMVSQIEVYSIWLDDRIDLDFKLLARENLDEEIILKLIDNDKSYIIIK